MKEEEKKKKKTTKQKKQVNKNTTKKTTIKKKPIKGKKNENSNDFFTVEHLLLMFFIVLILVVVGLGIMVVKKNKEVKKENDANAVFPIYKERENIGFHINARDLYNSGVYVIKITNYKGNKINKKDVNYKLTINNPTNFKIKVYKNDEEKDLMTEKSSIDIEDKLDKNEKNKVYYTIVSTDTKEPSKDSKISMIISE